MKPTGTGWRGKQARQTSSPKTSFILFVQVFKGVVVLAEPTSEKFLGISLTSVSKTDSGEGFTVLPSGLLGLSSLPILSDELEECRCLESAVRQ